jgi:uncharacterized protein YjbJ (UPF0337 family)
MINESVLKGKWTEIKGEVRKTWGSITGDEIEKTKGNAQALTGLLQQKYGMAADDAEDKLSAIINKYTDAAKNYVKGTSDETRIPSSDRSDA